MTIYAIANNVLYQKVGRKNIIYSVVTNDSKTSENIQMSDFLLGAIINS